MAHLIAIPSVRHIGLYRHLPGLKKCLLSDTVSPSGTGWLSHVFSLHYAKSSAWGGPSRQRRWWVSRLDSVFHCLWI